VEENKQLEVIRYASFVMLHYNLFNSIFFFYLCVLYYAVKHRNKF